MLNKLRDFIRRYQMLLPGDRVVCAVSGGADSVALLFALYLLSQEFNIVLSAAHFNHNLRGDESDRDEMFVRQLCDRLDVPLYVGAGPVVVGKKGLEAAARDARYRFFNTLSGKIATAHTADDNAETVLMHLIRGTGLKGLGGISPVNGNLIRPMLTITRREVLNFLQEYKLSYVTDSSNETDCFTRNRLRHHVIPLLRQENPAVSENLSAMALRLRDDEDLLSQLTADITATDIPALKQLPGAIRRRWIVSFLQQNCMKEPEAIHVDMVERLIFSDRPSARLNLPDDLQISRQYDRLVCNRYLPPIKPIELTCPCEVLMEEIGVWISCAPANLQLNEAFGFTVMTKGKLYVRCREAGDTMRLPGGTKSLKKLFIDRKIPASQRPGIPVVVDDIGVLGVYGIGVNLDRLSSESGATEIRFFKKDER